MTVNHIGDLYGRSYCGYGDPSVKQGYRICPDCWTAQQAEAAVGQKEEAAAQAEDARISAENEALVRAEWAAEDEKEWDARQGRWVRVPCYLDW